MALNYQIISMNIYSYKKFKVIRIAETEKVFFFFNKLASDYCANVIILFFLFAFVITFLCITPLHYKHTHASLPLHYEANVIIFA